MLYGYALYSILKRKKFYKMKDIKAIVIGGKNKKRKGKGFSLKELKEANLDIKKAKAFKIPIDKRRKSAHKENIEFLKNLKTKLKDKS